MHIFVSKAGETFPSKQVTRRKEKQHDDDNNGEETMLMMTSTSLAQLGDGRHSQIWEQTLHTSFRQEGLCELCTVLTVQCALNTVHCDVK